MKITRTFSLFLNPFRPLLSAPCAKCKTVKFSPDLMRAANLFICSACVPEVNREAMRTHAALCFAELTDAEKRACRVALYGEDGADRLELEVEARKNILQKGLTRH